METPTATLVDAPLAGASVIVTRPAGTNAATVRRIRALGGRPVALPGQRLLTIDALDDARAALAQAAGAEIAIFVSPAAVRHAWQVHPTLRFATTTRVAAVGAATARALRRHGVRDVLAPTTSHDSAGLLARDELAELAGRRVALVGAAGGRDELPATLRARGATLIACNVYRRAPPRWNKRQLAALETTPRPWLVLVSSAQALANIVDALPPTLLAALRAAELIVSSDRLAGLATAHGFEHVHVARSALTPDLLHTACAALSRHRL